MAQPDLRTAEDRQWDEDIAGHIAALGDVIKWAGKWEGWGHRNKDWHTERECGRVRHYLELAVLELYDLQYIKEEKEVKEWRLQQYTDRKSRRPSR